MQNPSKETSFFKTYLREHKTKVTCNPKRELGAGSAHWRNPISPNPTSAGT